MAYSIHLNHATSPLFIYLQYSLSSVLNGICMDGSEFEVHTVPPEEFQQGASEFFAGEAEPHFGLTSLKVLEEQALHSACPKPAKPARKKATRFALLWHCHWRQSASSCAAMQRAMYRALLLLQP